MFTPAYLMPTEWSQLRPIAGEYEAIVFPNHAEFYYRGVLTLARFDNGRMNADGNRGTVTVDATGSATIGWNHQDKGHASAVIDHSAQFHPNVDNVVSYSGTVTPRDFEQWPPGGSHVARAIGSIAEAGDYRINLDQNARFKIFDCPAIAFFMDNNPYKCIVQLDDDAVRLMKRFGEHRYSDLVKMAADKLDQIDEYRAAGLNLHG